MKDRIKIVSRSSILAKIQARFVGEQILKKNPTIKIDYKWVKTTGDLDQKLDISSGLSVGIFTGDISQRIINSDNEIAIHSWKDFPIADNDKSKIYATLERADMRDMLFLKKSITKLKELDAINIMTSSPRRRYAIEQNLKHLIPIKFNQIRFQDLRGNIDTRLKKFIDGKTDGIVIAKAAIERILHTKLPEAKNIKKFISDCLAKNHWVILPLSSFPTAPGQGAIGIEVANKNKRIIDIVKTINHKKTYENVNKERTVMSQYGGGCSQKIGVSVWNKNNTMVQSIFGITEQNEKLVSFGIIKRMNKKSFRKKDLKENDIFPKNSSEQNIFERVAVNKNKILNKIENSIIYITRKNVLKHKPIFKNTCILWTSGLKSWQAAAKLGYWVHGTSDSMGESEINSISTLFRYKIPTIKLTFLNDQNDMPNEIDVYELKNPTFPEDIENRSEYFWMSTLAFDTAIKKYPKIQDKQHACGMGNTYNKLKKIINDNNKIECYISYESWLKSIRE